MKNIPTMFNSMTRCRANRETAQVITAKIILSQSLAEGVIARQLTSHTKLISAARRLTRVAQHTTVVNWQSFNHQIPEKGLGQEETKKKKIKITQKGNRSDPEKAGGPGKK